MCVGWCFVEVVVVWCAWGGDGLVLSRQSFFWGIPSQVGGLGAQQRSEVNVRKVHSRK